jgi:uncharacterized protein YecT (DUF1311 family)
MIARLLLFSLFVVAVHASNSAPDELVRLQRALDSAMTQTDMNIASGELAKYWDRELAKEEARVLGACDSEHAKLFRSAQKSWRDFRSAETKFHGDVYRGGSIQPLIHNSTYAALTEQRVKALRALADEK